MPSQSVLTGNIATAPPVDARIARHADRQHALVRIDQLLALGLSRSAVSKRVARGALFRKYRGVYSAGHAHLSREGELLAAVFAGGEGALLGHNAAAELLGVRRYRAPLIDVLVPRKRRSLPGVRFHEATIHARDRTMHKGIPVTSVPRLCVDLTESLVAIELASVIHEADFHGWLTLSAIEDAMRRANGRHHLDVLQRAIAYHLDGSAGARSRNEVRFFTMLEQAGLPEPRVNTEIEDIEVDFHWPDRRLVIEIDGDGHGRTRTRREDVLRDRVLSACGWTVLRFAGDRLDDALEAARR